MVCDGCTESLEEYTRYREGFVVGKVHSPKRGGHDSGHEGDTPLERDVAQDELPQDGEETAGLSMRQELPVVLRRIDTDDKSLRSPPTERGACYDPLNGVERGVRHTWYCRTVSQGLAGGIDQFR